MFGDTDDLSIQAKIYDASGLGQGFLQFRVNTYTTNDQFHPSVAAALDDRSFVVTWASYGSYGTDEHGSSIQGQRYRVGNPSVPALPPSAGLPLGATLLLLGSYVLLRRSKRRPTSRASTWWSVTTGKGV
jgi:hypothetical protein